MFDVLLILSGFTSVVFRLCHHQRLCSAWVVEVVRLFMLFLKPNKTTSRIYVQTTLMLHLLSSGILSRSLDSAALLLGFLVLLVGGQLPRRYGSTSVH